MKIRPEKIILDQNADGSIAARIETPRLILKPVTSADADDYHRVLYNDSTVMEKFASGKTLKLEQVKEKIEGTDEKEGWEERWQEGDPFSSLAIRLKDGTFIGQITMGHGDAPGVSEVAYILGKDFWNQGYGSEAAHAVVSYLAPILKSWDIKLEGKIVDTVEATARPDNAFSVKILKNACDMKNDAAIEKFEANRNHYQTAISVMPLTKFTNSYVDISANGIRSTEKF